MSTIIEPCCNDCFWDTKINYTDYSQGFMAGIKYAQEKVALLMWERTLADSAHSQIYAAVAADVERMLRSEPN